MTLRVFPIGKRKFFDGVCVGENNARDQTSCRRRRAAALHVGGEISLVVQLPRKCGSNIADFFIELQSLFEDRFETGLYGCRMIRPCPALRKT
jgi:hypothetical protein